MKNKLLKLKHKNINEAATFPSKNCDQNSSSPFFVQKLNMYI